jgi:hypothetical protein
MSASSLIPPSDIRTNALPIARAMDLPSDVLPTPGGQNGAFAFGIQFSYGQEFEDAFFDLGQVVVVGI